MNSECKYDWRKHGAYSKGMTHKYEALTLKKINTYEPSSYCLKELNSFH